VACGTVFFCKGQSDYQQYFLKKEDFQTQVIKLEQDFASNKIIPKEIELECLTALSFYPELKYTSIEFKFARLNFTMISKPRFRSVLKSREKRQYVIVIQKPGPSKTHLQWQELSFNALVGWIGHELGHIVHYSNKSTAGIMFIGVKYGIPGYRRKMERFTDQVAIQHNLGFALYEGVDYTMKCPHASAHYKRSQEKFYLQPNEILSRIESKQAWSAVFRKTKMKYTGSSGN
jgi:hypothetical protein